MKAFYAFCKRAACVGIACLFLGCSAQTEEIPDMVLSSTMPRPEAEREYPYFETTLYFPSADNGQLIPQNHRIVMSGDGSHVEAAVRALFESPGTQTQQAVLQTGLEYEKMEISSDLCNVYVRGGVELDEKKWVRARAALAATVQAVDGTSNINLYYNQEEPGYIGRPLGALSPIVEKLDVYVRNLELEYEALQKEREEKTADASFELRNAALYFMDETGGLLLSQCRMVSYEALSTTEDVALILLEALKQPLEDGKQQVWPALPKDMEAFHVRFVPDAAAQVQDETEDAVPTAPMEGPGILELALTRSAEPVDEDMLCASITLTLSGFLPQLHGVRIAFVQSETANLNTADWRFCTREDFSGRIGHGVAFCYPQEDGIGLYRTTCAVAGDDSYAPETRLGTMLESAESKAYFSGFGAADIANIYISGNTAVVDWKAGFGKKLAALAEDGACPLPEEKRVWLFVYSVVNTMTEFPGLQQVWMLEDGKKMGTCGGLYLGNALMRNPGIMIETVGS